MPRAQVLVEGARRTLCGVVEGGSEHRRDRCVQGRRLDRLRDNGPDARARPSRVDRHVVLADRRRQDDRERGLPFVDPLGEVEAVHDGHQHVEHGKVDPTVSESRKRFLGAGREHRLDPPGPEKRVHETAVRLVIVDDERPPIGERAVAPKRRGRHLGRPGLDRDVERAALAGNAGAVYPDGSVHQLSEAPADREPETGAAEATAGRCISLAEGLEEPIGTVGRDADARVAHRHVVADRVRAFRGSGGRRDDDLARVRELHGVVEQVQEDLPDPADVADRRLGRAGLDVVRDLEALSRSHRAD